MFTLGYGMIFNGDHTYSGSSDILRQTRKDDQIEPMTAPRQPIAGTRETHRLAYREGGLDALFANMLGFGRPESR